MNLAAEIAPRSLLTHAVLRVAGVLRDLGPYAALELLLPGGSILALLLWFYRRRHRPAQVLDASAAPAPLAESAG